MAKGKIFMSYRREDTRADARSIHDRLTAAFGAQNVFMDVDSLQPGRRFDQELGKALDQSDVFLALIGPRWREFLEARMRAGERDYVREEISTALARGIIVIPVLIEGVGMPAPEVLPKDISMMSLYQKCDVTHQNFGRDMATLIDAIRTARGEPPKRPPQLPKAGPALMKAAMVAAALAALWLGANWAAAAWDSYQYQSRMAEDEEKRKQEEYNAQAAARNIEEQKKRQAQFTLKECKAFSTYVVCNFSLLSDRWDNGLCVTSADSSVFDSIGARLPLSEIAFANSGSIISDNPGWYFVPYSKGIRADVSFTFRGAAKMDLPLQALRISYAAASNPKEDGSRECYDQGTWEMRDVKLSIQDLNGHSQTIIIDP